MEWFYEAEDILGKLNTNGIPRKNLNQYAAVYADYLVKNKQYEEAVPYFKTAIKAEKNRRQRTRMKYLLGQIYAEQDQNGLAYQMFGQVIKVILLMNWSLPPVSARPKYLLAAIIRK